MMATGEGEMSDSESSQDDDFAAFCEMLNTPPGSPLNSPARTKTKEHLETSPAPSASSPRQETSIAFPDDAIDTVMDMEIQVVEEKTTMDTSFETEDATSAITSSDNNMEAVDGAVAIAQQRSEDNNNNHDYKSKNVVVAVVDDHNDDDHDHDDDDDDDEPEDIREKWMVFASTLLFLIGSVLYLVMSVMDYQWAETLHTLPMWLRTVDDDISWTNYRLEEQYNASVGAASTSGGVRRRMTRQLWRLEEEEREHQEAELELAAALEIMSNAKNKVVASYEKVERKEEEVVHFGEEEEEATQEVAIKTVQDGSTSTNQGKTRRVTAKAAKRAAQALPPSSTAKTVTEALLAEFTTSGRRKLQTPEELYYDCCWGDLPSDIQDAYTTLGYNEDLWDNGGETTAGTSFWFELSEEQQEAALSIGYTEDMWCVDTGMPVMAPTIAIPQLPVVVVTSSPVTNVPTNRPTTLNPTRQPTPRPVTPNPTRQPTLKPVTGSPITNQPTRFPTRSPTRRPTRNPTKRPTLKPVTPSPTNQPTLKPVIATQYWQDFSPDIQDVYVDLGFNEESWNTGQKVSVDDKTWEELNLSERVALFSLGFTRNNWDASELGEHFSSYQPVSVSIVRVPVQYWDDLPTELRNLYVALGYNSVSWNTGGKVPIDQKTWDGMALGERIALATSGVTQDVWDAAELGEHFPHQPSAVVVVVTPDPTREPTSTPTETPSEIPTNSPMKSPTPRPSVAPSTSAPTTTSPITSTPTTASPVTSAPTTAAPITASPTTSAPITASPTTSAPVTASPTPPVPTTAVLPVVPAPTTATQPAASTGPTPAVVPAPTTATQPVAPTGPTPGELYYDEWFKDLPPEIRAAYEVLGYNETMWNKAIEPPSDDLFWDELTPEMQEAALFIGYTKEAWDADTMGEVVEPAVGIDEPNVFEPTADEPVASAASTVAPPPEDSVFAGYFPNTNTSEETPSNTNTSEKTGEKPDQVEKAGVVEAGYYDNFDWGDLPPEVQEAAATLGYDEQLWDMNGVAWSDDVWWHELSPEAKEAAALLGYDEEAWNEGEDPWANYESNDDDYVFRVGALEDDIWVSQYQILYFFAALSFVFVGILDLIQERHYFHILMILAGVFGVASSVYVEEDIRLSNILNAVSVHLYLLEGISLFGFHKRAEISEDSVNWIKKVGLFGDLSFVVGSGTDVVLSYFYLLDNTSDWDIPLNSASIFASVMWLICSLIYLGAWFYYYYPKEKPVAPKRTT